jgi:hypothetical protein
LAGSASVGRLLLTLLAGLAFSGAVASGAAAAEWNHRWFVGFRLGDFLPADEVKGGFREEAGSVVIEEVPLGTLSFGRGLKKWERTQLVLEVQASRITGTVGDETVFLDPDGSTRVEDPVFGSILGYSGDESSEARRLGEVTMTPIFVNALFHWSGKRDPERADFYVGGGLGAVISEFEESSEYRSFANDYDGVDDIFADTSFGVLLKTGANVRLARDRDWYLYFEGEFIATQLLGSQAQIGWNQVDYLAGSRAVDVDNNGSPDVIVPADYRLMDAGRLRVDGAVAGIGIRYRFGKGKGKAAPAAAASSEPATTETPQD